MGIPAEGCTLVGGLVFGEGVMLLCFSRFVVLLPPKIPPNNEPPDEDCFLGAEATGADCFGAGFVGATLTAAGLLLVPPKREVDGCFVAGFSCSSGVLSFEVLANNENVLDFVAAGFAISFFTGGVPLLVLDPWNKANVGVFVVPFLTPAFLTTSFLTVAFFGSTLLFDFFLATKDTCPPTPAILNVCVRFEVPLGVTFFAGFVSLFASVDDNFGPDPNRDKVGDRFCGVGAGAVSEEVSADPKIERVGDFFGTCEVV